MKRMSEVFELPLAQLPEADDQIQDANEDWALIVRLPWRTDYVINAINHVDALEGALLELLELASDAGLQNRNSFAIAQAVLSSYRGEK
jgi:hypothetical protein